MSSWVPPDDRLEELALYFSEADRAVDELSTLVDGTHSDDTVNLSAEHGPRSGDGAAAAAAPTERVFSEGGSFYSRRSAETDATPPTASMLQRMEDDRIAKAQAVWELVNDDTRKSVKVYRKNVPGATRDQTLVKGVGLVQCPIEMIEDWWVDILEKHAGPVWDPLFESGQMVEKLDRHTCVLYVKFSATYCLSKKRREFCVLHHWFNRLDPQTRKIQQFVIVARSIMHPQSPRDPEYVRGEIFPTGYVFTRASDTETSLTYLSDLDLKPEENMLADFMRQKVNTVVLEKQPLNIFYIRASLPRAPKVRFHDDIAQLLEDAQVDYESRSTSASAASGSREQSPSPRET